MNRRTPSGRRGHRRFVKVEPSPSTLVAETPTRQASLVEDELNTVRATTRAYVDRRRQEKIEKSVRLSEEPQGPTVEELLEEMYEGVDDKDRVQHGLGYLGSSKRVVEDEEHETPKNEFPTEEALSARQQRHRRLLSRIFENSVKDEPSPRRQGSAAIRQRWSSLSKLGSLSNRGSPGRRRTGWKQFKRTVEEAVVEANVAKPLDTERFLGSLNDIILRNIGTLNTMLVGESESSIAARTLPPYSTLHPNTPMICIPEEQPVELRLRIMELDARSERAAELRGTAKRLMASPRPPSAQPQPSPRTFVVRSARKRQEF